MKLIQLNIERNLHLARFMPFLEQEQPDVVCLQEVMATTLPHIAARLGMQASFAPEMVLSGYEPDTEGDEFGVAILTREPHTCAGEHYYVRSRDTICVRHKTYDGTDDHESDIAKVLLVAEVTVRGAPFVVGCTQFTWSPGGKNTALQKRDLGTLCGILDRYPKLVVCGDFNIPRGNELYHTLNARLTDTVPRAYTTSIDQELHRVPGLRLMVDYIWTTPAYHVENVRMVCGVSDHCALVAQVSAL